LNFKNILIHFQTDALFFFDSNKTKLHIFYNLLKDKVNNRLAKRVIIKISKVVLSCWLPILCFIIVLKIYIKKKKQFYLFIFFLAPWLFIYFISFFNKKIINRQNYIQLFHKHIKHYLKEQKFTSIILIFSIRFMLLILTLFFMNKSVY
jgi:hypothetical protein